MALDQWEDGGDEDVQFLILHGFSLLAGTSTMPFISALE